MAVNHIHSQYDYLLKFLVVGNAGVGKSCILHQYVHSEFKTDSQHTIGAELGSKIVFLQNTSNFSKKHNVEKQNNSENATDSPFKKLSSIQMPGGIPNPLKQFADKDESDTAGPEKQVGQDNGSNQTRVKLQIWDTAGQERFRSVTRSYYRGACGALLVYDITDRDSFNSVSTWLSDAKTLASQNIVIILCGNKSDLESERQVTTAEAEQFASENGMYFTETSAKSGEHVEDSFLSCTQQVIDKVESGVIDPNAPGCGILVYKGASDQLNRMVTKQAVNEDGFSQKMGQKVDLMKMEADEAIDKFKQSKCCS